MKPSGLARPVVRDVEHGQVVGVGVGHEQHLAVRRQGQAVRRVAGRGVGVQGAVDRLQRLARRRIEDARRGRVGTGDVQSLAVLGRGPSRSGGRPSASGRRPCSSSRSTTATASRPQADEQPLAAGFRQAGVRGGRGRPAWRPWGRGRRPCGRPAGWAGRPSAASSGRPALPTWMTVLFSGLSSGTRTTTSAHRSRRRTVRGRRHRRRGRRRRGSRPPRRARWSSGCRAGPLPKSNS